MKWINTLAVLLVSTGAVAQTTNSFNIYFDHNRSVLRSDAKITLDSFIAVARPDNRIILDGYCDGTGTDNYNDNLSMQRIKSVEQYFLRNGISPSQFATRTGHGEKQPVAGNDTETGRQLNRRVSITLTQGDEKTLTEKIGDSTTTAGTNIVLKNLNFVGGMHRLLPEAFATLDELLAAMRNYPNLVIAIEGHICCQEGNGDGLDNETGIQNLSEARAKAIHDHLISSGIGPERVSYKGFGHSRPLYPFPENNEDEKMLNRRVEIRIIRK
jgi:outer membrane protein OmpA-like peptidoglycan-associated protein